MAQKHSIEAFYARDDPQETVVFSGLVELFRELKRAWEEAGFVFRYDSSDFIFKINFPQIMVITTGRRVARL